MNFAIAAIFDNYISAHLTLGRLQEAHINCWLKDEHTVAIDPGITYAVGGIKLMVAEPQLERALALIECDRQEYRQQQSCPQCGSPNVEPVSAARKAGNWFNAIVNAALSTAAAAPGEKVYHCLSCGNKYELE